MAKTDLTAQRLRELLHYDPETGVFTRIALGPENKGALGPIPLRQYDKGYCRIWINGMRFSAHRLAYLYMTGTWPMDEIDHINRNRADNRWENLRDATRKENSENRATFINNSSGVKGVCWSKTYGAWQVDIRSNRKRYTIGRFENLEDAALAYAEAAAKYHTCNPSSKQAQQTTAEGAPSTADAQA